jgi:hypothetical protein
MCFISNEGVFQRLAGIGMLLLGSGDWDKKVKILKIATLFASVL